MRRIVAQSVFICPRGTAILRKGTFEFTSFSNSPFLDRYWEGPITSTRLKEPPYSSSPLSPSLFLSMPLFFLFSSTLSLSLFTNTRKMWPRASKTKRQTKSGKDNWEGWKQIEIKLNLLSAMDWKFKEGMSNLLNISEIKENN